MIVKVSKEVKVKYDKFSELLMPAHYLGKCHYPNTYSMYCELCDKIKDIYEEIRYIFYVDEPYPHNIIEQFINADDYNLVIDLTLK